MIFDPVARSKSVPEMVAAWGVLDPAFEAQRDFHALGIKMPKRYSAGTHQLQDGGGNIIVLDVRTASKDALDFSMKRETDGFAVPRWKSGRDGEIKFPQTLEQAECASRWLCAVTGLEITTDMVLEAQFPDEVPEWFVPPVGCALRVEDVHGMLHVEAETDAGVFWWPFCKAKRKTHPKNSLERLTGSAAQPPTILHQAATKAAPEGEKAVSSCKPIAWRSLAGKSPPERAWIVDDWLTHGPTLFVGTGGIGKTQLAQQASTCLAVGKDFIGHVNRPCRVLLWACEDDENELWRRQDAICRHYEVPMADLDDKLIIMPRLGMDNTLYTTEFGKPMFTPGIAELEEQINDYAADVVLLDNIGQVYGANENDRHSVTKFVNGLIGACNGRPVAVVLLGHPARSAGSEFAGSGAWENAVRMRWLLSSRLPDSPDPDRDEPPDEAVRYLSKRKANYSGKDFRQFTFRDGVLALDANPADAGGMTGFARRKQAERVVLESVVRLSAMAVFVSDRNGARNFAPSVILQYKLAEGLTKRELGDAMRNLMLDGKIKRDVVGHYSNRNEQFGLVVAP